MIVLMTPYQRDVITKYASEKICVDTTHKPTDYDFLLTSLVTVDEFGAGCPIAFCLSNRIDGVAMEQFFKAVEKKVGKILVNVFMSDDAPAYVNAWTEIMSEPQPRAQSNLDMLRNLLADKEKTPASSDFPKLPKNLPSHQNIEKQRFYTTRKKKTSSERKLAKPTTMEKASIKAVYQNPERRSEHVHTDFDHTYDPDSAKFQPC